MSWKIGVKNHITIKRIKLISWWLSVKKHPYGMLWIVPFNNAGKKILAFTYSVVRATILALVAPDAKKNLIQLHELYNYYQKKLLCWGDGPQPSYTVIRTAKEIMQLAYILNQQGFEDELLEAFCPDLTYIRYLAKN